MRVLVLVVIAAPGCASHATPAAAAHHQGTGDDAHHVTTDLEVLVIDGYRWPIDDCAGAAARHVQIALDGVEVAIVEVPCEAGVRAPPRALHARPFAVSPGRHRVTAREVETGVTGTRELVFPVIEPSEDGAFLADKLPVLADEHTISIGEPRVIYTSL